MIAEITFTCGRHVALAARSDRARPGVRRIWVVDTADAEIVAPEGVEVWVMPFDRGGNLNGWPCLAGMLAAFRRAFADGATAVIKKDSDTRVLDDAMLTAFDEHVVAIGAHQAGPHQGSWQIFGCCYALAPHAMPILERAVAARDFPSNHPREDNAISWFLRGVSRVHPWTAIRFLLNRDTPPGCQFAENANNLWLPSRGTARGAWRF